MFKRYLKKNDYISFLSISKFMRDNYFNKIFSFLNCRESIQFMMDSKFRNECRKKDLINLSFRGITNIPRENLNINGIIKNIQNLSGVNKIFFDKSFSNIFNSFDIFNIRNVKNIYFYFEKNNDDIKYKKFYTTLVSKNNLNLQNNINNIKIIFTDKYFISIRNNYIEIFKNNKSNSYIQNNNSKKINKSNLIQIFINPCKLSCRYCLDYKYGCDWCNNEYRDEYRDEYHDEQDRNMNDCDYCGKNVQYINEYGLCTKCNSNKNIKKIKRKSIEQQIMESQLFIKFN